MTRTTTRLVSACDDITTVSLFFKISFVVGKFQGRKVKIDYCAALQ